MSVQFLMIPILTLTPPTPHPRSLSSLSTELDVSSSTVDELEIQVEPYLTSNQARSDVKEIVRSYLQGGGGGGALPFANLEPVEKAQPGTDNSREVEKESVAIEHRSRGKKGWNARRRAEKAKKVLRVDQKLENALSGFGW